MPLTPKEMIRLLLQNGFVYVKSNNGSHQKYYNGSLYNEIAHLKNRIKNSPL